ncbi:hypothetical protein ASPBRDRAFT_282097 [Aspergillus brasiliensis CBS 101740]|uniref:Uncharacterized protein n=1 Tax=Aspergillus brasiliensis (strain CBS 101740 / IMI 381727 / IBT 21946) TaxID=767769 RepID=A0A1L9UD46_ASPBC|nr:hypothetical protein ASPBRDRAFT_282097 [Aspergillus brasiliensis CBS 101740]
MKCVYTYPERLYLRRNANRPFPFRNRMSAVHLQYTAAVTSEGLLQTTHVALSCSPPTLCGTRASCCTLAPCPRSKQHIPDCSLGHLDRTNPGMMFNAIASVCARQRCTCSSCRSIVPLHGGAPEDEILNQADDRSVHRSNMTFAYGQCVKPSRRMCCIPDS